MIEVVYSAFGQSFVRNAAISATSVKRHTPGLITSLTTGEPVSCSAFDKVKLVEAPADASQQARFAKAQKASAILNSSADRVLYLDADTYVTANLIDWFSVLDDADIALSHDTWRYQEVYRALHPHTHLEDAPHWQTYFNTGVIFVKRSRAVDRFLRRWAEEFAADGRLVRDQLVFQRLIYKSGLRVHALPAEINVRASEPIHISGRVTILHRAPFQDDNWEWRASSAFLSDFLNSYTENRVFTPHDGRLVVMGHGHIFEENLANHEARVEKEEYLHPPIDFASAESASDTKLETSQALPAKPPKSSRMTLYTSLPGELKRTAIGRELGAAYQKACIDSWQRAGFDVVSLNCAREIEELSSAGFNVRFIESGDAPPRIGDILDTVRQGTSEVAGIINADCLIIAPDGIIGTMVKAAREGLVMAERMNLDPENLSVTGVSCEGFDFFLFGRDRINERNFDDKITMGTPWWDYWFPLSHQQTGGQLFLVSSPVLLHLDHGQSWNLGTYALQRRRFHEALSSNKHAALKFPFIEYDRTVTDDDLATLAPAAYAWLQETPVKLRASDERSEFLSLFLSALNESSARTKSQIDKLSDALSAMHSRAERAEASWLQGLLFLRKLGKGPDGLRFGRSAHIE